jgi:radical SAM protein with 4Fe4S-binding SPASM domain
MSEETLVPSQRILTPPHLRVWPKGEWHLYYDPHNFVWTNVNASGRYVLELIRQYHTVDSIAASIAADFDMSLSDARLSLIQFVAPLVESGFLHWDEYREHKRIEFPVLQVPHAIYLHMTDRCNLKCPYCYNKDYRETNLRMTRELEINPELTTEQYKSVIFDLIDCGVKQLFFTGGEPLLRADTLDLIEYARSLSQSLNIEILTNAIKIDEEVAARLCRSVNTVTISLDGHEQHLHEYYRGKHTFQPTIDGIRTLLRVRSAMGRKTPSVCTVPVLTQQSIPYMQDIFRFALEDLGVDMLAPILFQPGDHQEVSLSQIPDHDLYVNKSAELMEFLRQRSSANAWTQFDKRPVAPREQCGAANGEMSIDPHGQVYPCQSLHFPEFLCGDTTKTSLKDIFKNSSVAKHVRGMTVGEMEVCSHCDLKNLCNGGCRANAYNLYRTFDAHNEIYCQHLETIAVNRISRQGNAPVDACAR